MERSAGAQAVKLRSNLLRDHHSFGVVTLTGFDPADPMVSAVCASGGEGGCACAQLQSNCVRIRCATTTPLEWWP